MLPLDKLHTCYADEAPAVAIGWFPDYKDELFLCGVSNSMELFVALGGAKVWSALKGEVNQHGAFLTDFEIRVDPRSYARFDHLADKDGALVVHNGRVMVHAPNPYQRGHLRVDMGEIGGHWSKHNPSAFTHWQIITAVGDKELVLLDFEVQPSGA